MRVLLENNNIRGVSNRTAAKVYVFPHTPAFNWTAAHCCVRCEYVSAARPTTAAPAKKVSMQSLWNGVRLVTACCQQTASLLKPAFVPDERRRLSEWKQQVQGLPVFLRTFELPTEYKLEQHSYPVIRCNLSI